MPSVDILQCCACLRLFWELLKLQEKSLQLTNAGKPVPRPQIKRIESLTNSFNNTKYGRDEGRDMSKVCFLNFLSCFPCSDDPSHVYHPTRLASRNLDTIKVWCELFSKAVGIAHQIAEEVYMRCADIRLCTVHSSHLKKCLDVAQGKNQNTSDSFPGRVVRSPCQSLHSIGHDWVATQRRCA